MQLPKYALYGAIFAAVIVVLSLMLFRPVARKVKFSILYPFVYFLIAIIVYLLSLGSGKAMGQGFLWAFLIITGFPATQLSRQVIEFLNIKEHYYFVAPALAMIQYFLLGLLIDIVAAITIKKEG